MKRTLAILAIVVVLVSLLVIWWKVNTAPVDSKAVFQNFVIPKGYSASQIGNKLKDKGMARSALAFKFYIQLTGKAEKIQAGEYRLSSDLSLVKLVEILLGGPSEVWVTIPEGLRREEIAGRFLVGLDKKTEESLIFQEEFLSLSEEEEGFLFPDTYLFPKTASASAVIRKMTQTFDLQMREFPEILEGGRTAAGHNLREVITLASLLERETVTNEERPLVAGILFNRIEAGWPLQVDAAVQYAVANRKCGRVVDCDWWPGLTKEDISIPSSYNTYQNPGLPPGPIANPGISSIEAIIYPEDSGYWFYLHDPNGKIHYAETLEEHNQNIARYLGK